MRQGAWVAWVALAAHHKGCGGLNVCSQRKLPQEAIALAQIVP